MTQLRQFQVDAFADHLFSGNPAAVVLMEGELEDSILLKIAQENNLSETAFIYEQGENYRIRWFTPAREVILCGHATLASAHVLFEHCGYSRDRVEFNSMSGLLLVEKGEGFYGLDLPTDRLKPEECPKAIRESIVQVPEECYKGRENYFMVLSSQKELEECQPRMEILKHLDSTGLIVTAPGEEVDFVSRYFAPQLNIPEDPVTGSAHASLTPYWSKRLNKSQLSARQLSARQGSLTCIDQGDRVVIQGKAKTFMEGKIFLK